MSGIEWEYKALRDEILQNQRNCLQITTVCVTATGAIFGFLSKGSNSPGLFLTPLVFLVPGFFIFISQYNGILRIGSYIRIFLEVKFDELNYEKRLFDRKKNESFVFSPYILSIYFVYMGLSALCFYLCDYFDKSSDRLIEFGLLFLFYAGTSYYALKQAGSRQRQEDFWKAS